MHRKNRISAALGVSFSLAVLFALGCSDAGTITQNPAQPALVKGNWQVTSTSPMAARLPAFSGNITTQAGSTTAVVHTQSATACIAPATSFNLAGAADEKGILTLSGPVANGTLTLTGVIAADGKSLTNASYIVVGGACAFPQTAQANAQAFQPLTGNYAGTFADNAGQVAQVTANFSQSTTPDTNGNFTLAGSAAVSNNPCFPTTVPVSNTQVTGGTFTFTYAANGSSVTATGTFSPDATTLTVSQWTSSGTCGADIGVQSTMTRAAN